jgi:hypothetical protein
MAWAINVCIVGNTENHNPIQPGITSASICVISDTHQLECEIEIRSVRYSCTVVTGPSLGEARRRWMISMHGWASSPPAIGRSPAGIMSTRRSRSGEMAPPPEQRQSAPINSVYSENKAEPLTWPARPSTPSTGIDS